MLPIILAIENDEQRKFMERLYLNHNKKMYAYLRRRLQNNQDAEDALQHTFVRMIKNIQKYRSCEKQNLDGLIVILMRSICSNMLNNLYRKVTIPIDEEWDADSSETPSVEDVVISRETTARLTSIIGELSDDKKDIVQLRLIYGYSFIDIAEFLDLSYDVVRQRFSRAMKILRQQIAEDKESVV